MRTPMQVDINPKILNVKESATLAINQQVLEMRAKGESVYHFGFGQSPFPVPIDIQQALADHTDKKSYLPTRGLPSLLSTIARFYEKHCGLTVSADQICVGPGSKELIFQAIYLLEGPLIIPAPSWVSYGPQAEIVGKKIVTIETQRTKGYRLSAEDLERVCGEAGSGQKILILNNPNNPTGSSHSEAELIQLAKVCRANHVIVISDEIYGLVLFNKKKHTSLSHFYPEGTIITGGLSKAFSAGGYRLGVMIIPQELTGLMKALMSFISETFSAVSAPIQYAAQTAYEYGDAVRQEVEKCTEIHQFAGEYLHGRFIKMGLNCPRPEGAFYLFPDFEPFREALADKQIYGSKQLVAEILTTVKVALLPASDFYLDESHLGVRVASVDYDGIRVLANFPGKAEMNPQLLEDLFPNLIAGCNNLEKYLETL
ncbi:MAG: aminotransferase class I/II-fold pyridoxal phosphate-dependent enzyme [Pseudomonadales bacterium]|nr:aminotransferase class I/II-fold pyridoxal phosphate-dependent enzyme [Pseudomonadales bacterium]